MGLDFSFMLEIFPTMLKALLITIQISIIALLFGTLGGVLIGSLRVAGPKWLQALIQLFVDYIRGTPQMIHILIIYFALPQTGIVLNEFWTGVVALTFIATGYEVEIVRASIESLNRGQVEAAYSLGMGKWKTLIFILLPQAARRMIPALTNELVNTVKASALLSVIAVNELTKITNKIIYETFYFFEVLIISAILYIIIIALLTSLAKYFENRMFTIS